MKNLTKVKMGFKKKMLFAFLPVIVLVFVAMTYFIYMSNDKLIHRMAMDEATSIAHEHANKLSKELTEYLTIARTYNFIMNNYKDIDINTRRSYYLDITGKYLKANENLLAVWFDFDKDSLDGKDAQYMNNSSYSQTGRANIVWNRGTGAEKIAVLQNIEADLGSEYYARPRKEKNEIILSPYYYSYTGNDEDAFLMTTISLPIYNANKAPVGVSSIDISLESIKKLVDEMKPFGIGYAVLISNEGTFVSNPDPTALGKKITENIDFSDNGDILPNVQNGTEFSIENYSSINEVMSLEIFVPIKFGNITTPMSLGVCVPYTAIFAENEAMLRTLILLCSIALIIIGITVFLVANMLSKPLITLTNEADKLAAGNLNINISSKASDETGVLSSTVGHVAEVLQQLLKDINNMITAASNGELNIRVDSNQYDGSYRELISGVNTLLDNVTAPINLSAEYLDRISKGDIPLPITETFKGDFNEIKNSLNGCIKAVGLLVIDTNYLVDKALVGDLHARADVANHFGDYKKIIDGMNNLLDAVGKPIQTTSAVLRKIAIGADDIAMIEDDYKGEFNDIKNNMNTTYATLVFFSSEIRKLFTAAASGNLDVRADTNKLQGGWREMGEGVNAIFAVFSKLISDSGDILATMATGDLTMRMTGEYHGQFLETKNNINNLGDSLNTLVSNLTEMIHTTASAAAQISATAETLASATQQQSSQTEEVAIAVSDMSKTATDNAESAVRTSQLAKQSGSVANNGGIVVTQTVQKMREIADVVHNSALSIEHLGKSSKEIGEIVEVINDIADQTNLLALNAAIEAARAGEQGRGFAVVADEVRKLSERTADATRQIADMINSIQNETNLAVEAMSKGTNEVQNGIQLADKAGSSLTEIMNSTNELLNMINHIARASKEQSASSEKIASNVNSISHVTTESAHNIEDVATTAAELARLTDALSRVINNFKILPANHSHTLAESNSHYEY